MGTKLSQIPFAESKKLWQHVRYLALFIRKLANSFQPWVLAHRVALHNKLKQVATSDGGQGQPAILHLASPLVDVDPSTATVTLKDGTQHTADVIVGADGVHSITRSRLPDGAIKPFGSGKSAFRFLVPRQAILDDPQTRHFAENDGNMTMVYGRDRRVVMYPTNNNTLMNFVCIHPTEFTDSRATGDWSNGTSKAKLMEVYRDFHEDCRAVLEKVDEDSLKVWELLDMKTLNTWVSDRLVLIGDAAHPFLPHQGQGGSQAMEDGVALGVVLEAGLSPEEIPARLKLFDDIRKDRAHRIQEYSRLAGADAVEPKVAAKTMQEFTNYNFGHDEYDNACQKLREWKWYSKPQTYWRMPLAFGPMPGPRQTHEGVPRSGVDSTFTTASIRFKTSRTVLQNLFPPGPRAKNWRFKSPGTFAYASFSQTTLDRMQWLGNSGYSHIGLYIHGVEYVDDSSKIVSGTYMPILFESLTDPIVSGREELGMPKLYTAVDIERDSTSYHIRTSWKGMTWGRFEFNNLTVSDNASGVTGKISGDDSDEGILVHRYIPAVGKSHKGEAEADYAVFDKFSEAVPTPKPHTVYQSANASIHINPRDWKALPTLHHIVSRLAEIPVYEVVSAKIVEGTGVPDVSGARPVSEFLT